MSQYKTGTASVVNGSASVSGTGTAWLANVQVGNSFKFQGENAIYNVNSVSANGAITISPVYAGVTKVNVPYTIARDFTGTGLYEISPNDVDWAFFMTLNMRMLSLGLPSVACVGGGAIQPTVNPDGTVEWSQV